MVGTVGETRCNIRADIFTTDKKYKVIYADPPWTFTVWSEKGGGRGAERHYQTMSKEDIQRLPVERIAADNSVLFLWVTAPNLIEGIDCSRVWAIIHVPTRNFACLEREEKSSNGVHIRFLRWCYRMSKNIAKSLTK